MALAIGLGCFLIAIALVKDMCKSINSIDDIANADRNPTQMIEKLSDFHETHSGLLELSPIRFIVVYFSHPI